MPVNVSDIRANLNENIRHAASIIARSVARRKVFEAIYYGKRPSKRISEIANKTRLKPIRVLQEGGRLRANQIVEQLKIDGETAYKKLEIYADHKNKILSIIDNPNNIKKFPTKQSPSIGASIIKIALPSKRSRIWQITVDDIESFSNVRSFKKPDKSLKLHKLSEKHIKQGIQRIIGNTEIFKDWGGETNDFYTSAFRLKKKRISAAFALKGKATKGILKPNKMGKNGDQIARLFTSPAHVFIVIYHSKIDESVLTQMQVFALAKSLSGQTIYYGVIGGDDLNRLYQAYRSKFEMR